jgi:SsrA-binding protein
VNLRDSYCRLEGAEAYLLGAHIGQYSHDSYHGHDPIRPRKLLLKRAELNKLLGKTTGRGLTIVPVKLYFKGNRVKVAIALARGKKLYDKRETIRRRETERETRAAVKTRQV